MIAMAMVLSALLLGLAIIIAAERVANTNRDLVLEEAANIALGPADDEGGTWCDGEEIAWAIRAAKGRRR